MKGESGEVTESGSGKSSGRMDRKKREHRDRILKAASALFIARGAGSVSMDEVAEAADVARRTLFNHFSGKDELLYEVAAPVLEQAVRLAQVRLAAVESLPDPGLVPASASGELENSGRIGGSGAGAAVTGLCLDLWRERGRELGILYAVELRESPALAGLHARFLEILMKLMALAFPSGTSGPQGIAEGTGTEASSRARLAGRILFRTFVPLLVCLEGLPDAEARFQRAMQGALAGALLEEPAR